MTLIGINTWVNPVYAQTSSAAASSSTAEANTSAESSTASEKPIYSSTSERDNNLLANAKPDEIQWLETPHEKFIALYKLGETRKTKGSLVILHAPELPQLWPAPLDNLRRNLPIYGWETMTIPLPQKYGIIIPTRDAPTADATTNESSASNTSSANASVASVANEKANEQKPAEPEQKPLLPREQLIGERVDAGLAHLHKNGKYNIVVLTDNSSAPDGLAGLLKKTNKGNTAQGVVDGPMQALVLVNLQEKEPLTKEQLAAIFSVSNLPVLDVFLNPDDQYQIQVRRLHHAEAMRQNLKNYQQLILPPEHLATVDDKQTFWLEKVRGFMEKKAEGSEFSKKTNQTP